MKKLLIVSDSLGFNNGAHVATRAMIAALRARGVTVDLMMGSEFKVQSSKFKVQSSEFRVQSSEFRVQSSEFRVQSSEFNVQSSEFNVQSSEFRVPSVKVYLLPEPVRGIRWFVQGVYRRLKIAPVPRWVIDPWGRMRRVMRGYDTILVIGENSHYRWLVAGVTNASFLSTRLHLYTAKKKSPRKVVFIHTDYVSWKTSCDWAIEDARFDRRIYRGFDVIGVVGEANAARFREHYPEFKEKTRAFHNLFLGGGEKVGGESRIEPCRGGEGAEKIGGENRWTKDGLSSGCGGEPCRGGEGEEKVGGENRWTAEGACLIGRGEDAASTRLVTISRLELGPPKMMERLVRVAGALKRRGCRFDWKVYGKGHAADEARLKALAREEKVDDMLHFVGFTSDVRGALAEADLHVLLSAYEGAPNVIIEAQLAGVPCIATDVGAVREMIAEGTGLVLPQDEKTIVEMMARVIGQRAEFNVQSSKFKVQSSKFNVQSSEFRVQSSEFKVQSSEFGVQSSEFRVQSSEFRVQSSELERWKVGLKGYRYDNDRVMREYGELLGIG